ncbi:MAG TPA: hypothetical protein VI819_02845 [Patescibacteria group bacterium]|nr:hypothetical protein [Patescibacteria group bacterium]
METPPKGHLEQVVLEIRENTAAQLAKGGSLMVQINDSKTVIFKLPDTNNKSNKISFEPLVSLLRENPNSQVKFIILNSNHQIASVYKGHTKSQM